MPAPSVGQKFSGPKKVVPNQSMSLEEILSRFTRGEPLEIGRDAQFHESDDDLEKVSHMDLVDKAEFAEKLEDTKRKYDKQEKTKAKKLAEQREKMAVDQIIADKKAAEEAAEKKAK